jgi:hypothetical protein
MVFTHARTYHDVGGKSGWNFVEVADEAAAPAP